MSGQVVHRGRADAGSPRALGRDPVDGVVSRQVGDARPSWRRRRHAESEIGAPPGRGRCPRGRGRAREPASHAERPRRCPTKAASEETGTSVERPRKSMAPKHGRCAACGEDPGGQDGPDVTRWSGCVAVPLSSPKAGRPAVQSTVDQGGAAAIGAARARPRTREGRGRLETTGPQRGPPSLYARGPRAHPPRPGAVLVFDCPAGLPTRPPMARCRRRGSTPPSGRRGSSARRHRRRAG